MNHLIIGFGEIGKAIKQVMRENVSVYDTALDNKRVPDTIDVMHICFPYSDTFVQDVKAYLARYEPRHVIVYSTVPIGTSKSIGEGIVHSPVEGKHPDLALSILHMERWLGADNTEEVQFLANMFQELGIRTRVIESSDFTEAIKLLSTTEYGINIEFARYKKEVADAIGMDYQLTKDWNTVYNKLYRNLGLDGRYQKFVLDSPVGSKGGHCIIPNARLLDGQYPNNMVKIVGEL